MQQQIMTKNGKPKYIQIRDHILQDIRDGKLQVGSKLPRREQLIDKYSVARATLNMALNDLTKSGVLVAQRRHGTFVANTDSRTETAMICDFDEMGCDSPKPILPSHVGRNIFNYIMTHAPKNLNLNIVKFRSSQTTGSLERYRKVLLLMPTDDMLEVTEGVNNTEFCVINRSVPGVKCITTNHYEATRDITSFFLDKFDNECQIVYLDMTRFSQLISHERREGFIATCEEHQKFYRIISGNGFEIINPLVDLKLDPKKKLVIISSSRYLTGAVFKFSIIKKLTFGKNLFYADFDNFDTNINYGEIMMSVVQDYSGLGQAALDFLANSNADKTTQYIPHRIVSKNSYFADE